MRDAELFPIHGALFGAGLALVTVVVTATGFAVPGFVVDGGAGEVLVRHLLTSAAGMAGEVLDIPIFGNAQALIYEGGNPENSRCFRLRQDGRKLMSRIARWNRLLPVTRSSCAFRTEKERA